MLRNIAWIIIFCALLGLFVIIFTYIFFHGFLHFVGCVISIALDYWAAHKIAQGWDIGKDP